jgi:hypothetical protein
MCGNLIGSLLFKIPRDRKIDLARAIPSFCMFRVLLLAVICTGFFSGGCRVGGAVVLGEK